jgi:hypothetical protein
MPSGFWIVEGFRVDARVVRRLHSPDGWPGQRERLSLKRSLMAVLLLTGLLLSSSSSALAADSFGTPTTVGPAVSYSISGDLLTGDVGFWTGGSGYEPFGDSVLNVPINVGDGAHAIVHFDVATTDSSQFDWLDVTLATPNLDVPLWRGRDIHNPPDVTSSLDLSAYAGQTVTLRFGVHQDGFGDQTQAHVSVTLNAAPPDTTPPTLTVSHVSNANGWNNSSVPLNIQASDDSGAMFPVLCSARDGSLAGDALKGYRVAGDGRHIVMCAATDRAGNTTRKGDVIKIDSVAPSIASAGRTAANANGWNDSDVTVTWSCSDELSLAADGTVAKTLSDDGKDQSVTGTCADRAGNTADDIQSGINIDKTPPTVSYSSNQSSYTVADTVSIVCSAADALSGVDDDTCKSISGDASSFALGTHDYSASATDKAGNEASGSTSFTVTVDADSLSTLTERWVTNAGVARALSAKLDAARASIARGDTNSKDGQLDAYRNQLAAQSGKAIPADEAAILIKLSQAL